MKHSPLQLVSALLLLICLFFLLRLPFYAQELVGEEGIIAHLFLNEVRKPDYLLISRIDGVDLMAPSQHPAPMYEAINATGRVVKRFIPFDELDELEKAFVLRVVFSLPVLIVLLGAFLYVYRYYRDNLYYWLALFVTLISSPVVLVTSTELQVDSFFGIAIFGVWALFVALLSAGNASLKVQAALFFLCNLVAGLGKNEWSLILFLTLLLTLLYVLATCRRDPSFKGQAAVILVGLAGLAAGNLLSYLYDPLNYVMGWELMTSMSKNHSIFNKAKLLQLMAIMGSRWPYVAQNLLLLLGAAYLFLRSLTKAQLLETWVAFLLMVGGIAFVSTWSEYLPLTVVSFLVSVAVLALFLTVASTLLRREEEQVPPHPFALMPVLFSGLLFGAYFVSTWEVGPRYFAVALAVSLFALLSVARGQKIRLQRRLLVSLVLCLLVLDGISFLNLERYHRVVAHAPPAENGCLPVMSSGEAVFKKVDFLGGSCSREYLENMSRKYNRPLCGS